jgi:hypothetical protein
MTHPGGRPELYTPKLAEEICEEIENTPRGLDYICDQHEHFPSGRTVRRWLKQIPEFCPKYVRAKEIQADRMADEMIEISYDDKKDWRVCYDADGNEKTAFVPEAVNRARLKIDTLKWKTSINAPKKYSEKRDYTHDVSIAETERKIREVEDKYK